MDPTLPRCEEPRGADDTANIGMSRVFGIDWRAIAEVLFEVVQELQVLAIRCHRHMWY
jgi:hypothetical protein